MKLYSLDNSPFCAPVRLAIYAKGLDLPIEPPPGGLKSDEYRAASLTGNIPCLVLDDGTPLPDCQGWVCGCGAVFATRDGAEFCCVEPTAVVGG